MTNLKSLKDEIDKWGPNIDTSGGYSIFEFGPSKIVCFFDKNNVQSMMMTYEDFLEFQKYNEKRKNEK